MDKYRNTLDELISFFDIPGRPVTPKEFMIFWESLTSTDKRYFMTVDLS